MNAELWLCILLGFMGGVIFAGLLVASFLRIIIKKVAIGKDEEK